MKKMDSCKATGLAAPSVTGFISLIYAGIATQPLRSFGSKGDWVIVVIVLAGLSIAAFLAWCGYFAIKENRSSWKVFHAFSWASILILTNNPNFTNSSSNLASGN
ncbi:MAG: hypothetical protein HYW48_10900 [Deltaproteobacteria bacterium]|nr:hypothetical protein [Deltaproteobacteria bacterium]